MTQSFGQCFVQQALNFLWHKNCCVFPGATIAMFSWNRIRVILALPPSLAALSCAVVLLCQVVVLQEKNFFGDDWGVIVSTFSSVDLPPSP